MGLKRHGSSKKARICKKYYLLSFAASIVVGKGGKQTLAY
jgi:hypothetical protein